MFQHGSFIDAPQNIAGFDPTREAGSCWYDKEEAESAVAFFHDCLVYLDGPEYGKPFVLQDWQSDIVRTVFGWRRTDGSRRFRKIFWFVPRKNGKTTMAAGFALRCMYADGERRAQVYAAACDKEQASILFDMAKEQIEHNPTLAGASRIMAYNKRILFPKMASKLEALAANEAGGHGKNMHFGAYDEFHLWQTARHREQYHSLHTSTGNRPSPLELIITTAGWDTESLCFDEYETAKRIRDGLDNDDSYLPIIYEADSLDDWTDPETWAKANPNLDITISSDYIERECIKAQKDAAYENVFKRLHLNIWTQQKTRWLQMEHWDGCKVTTDDVAPASVGGLDMAAVADFTAWSLVGYVDRNSIRVRNHYWLPESKAREYERQQNLSIEQWVRDGWLTLIPAARIEHSYVYARIVEDCQKYRVGTIGYDPWNMEQLRVDLETHGLEMLEVRQGFGSMTSPTKELERQVLGHTLDHGNDPILAWMAGQAICKQDENGNIKPTKDGSRAKVDGLVAAINAIHALQCKAPQRPSIYETPGMLSI